jgi:hypothetical protein
VICLVTEERAKGELFVMIMAYPDTAPKVAEAVLDQLVRVLTARGAPAPMNLVIAELSAMVTRDAAERAEAEGEAAEAAARAREREERRQVERRREEAEAAHLREALDRARLEIEQARRVAGDDRIINISAAARRAVRN